MELLNNLKLKMKNMLVVAGADKVTWIDVNKIKIDPELKNIFIQKESDIQNITADMKINGFNPAHPIILNQDGVCVDGHTRYLSAIRSGIKKVAVIYKHYENRAQMIASAYQQQLNRRNLDENEIYKAYVAMKSVTNEKGNKVRSDQSIADELSVSRRQIAKFKEVERKADAATLESFKAGKLSLNAAYQKMKAKENGCATIHKKKPVTSKSERKTYQSGYSAGIRYAIQQLADGKTTEELLKELEIG